MKIWDQLGYEYEYTTATDIAGHVWMVVVVKATFDFPDQPHKSPPKSAAQTPLVFADTQTGEPGYSATLWETDFAFRKLRCDIVANGCAYAPGRKPATRVPVGIRIGNWSKVFEVVGNREWRAIGPVFRSTAPEPFLRMPFSYDTAWGGLDALDPKDTQPACYSSNPVGTGWSRTRNQRFIP